jgi:hypothetical protein
MSQKQKVLILLIVLVLFAGVIGAMFGPKLYQQIAINSAINKLEAGCRKGKPAEPEHGGIIRCTNSEWIIIDLHHGSRGFALAFTSEKKAYVETDYMPHPVIECWGEIIYGEDFGGYVSIGDFFEKNKSIKWDKIER